ncbi:MAG TPA: XdhC/CoxI family protein [Ktedonobacterales bacterium]|jgi:xanthine dehydrogenase accessory factor|nr:XdhC/CoxI family protein [Ktedonobacterales bacterium]
MRETLDDIARWLAEGKRVAQATVVSLVGSAPRRAGATLVVSDAGDIAGSVSNGCVEPDVVEQAQRVMRSGKPRLLTYGVSEEQNYERIGLSCGGEIRVFIERIEGSPELDALEAAHGEGRPAVRAMVIAAPAECSVALGETLTLVDGAEPAGALFISPLGGAVAARARELLGALSPVAEQMPLTVAPEPESEVEVFYQTLTPPRALVIVGAGHISIPLTQLAKVMGYHVTVVDPREAFNTRERLPDADELLLDWPDEALERLPINAATAVTILTHDEKFDTPSLVVALRKGAGYVGMVGSRGTRAKRDEALRAAGVGEDLIARIHGPIGLDIGARTPDEIALAILAQIVASARGKA